MTGKPLHFTEFRNFLKKRYTNIPANNYEKIILDVLKVQQDLGAVGKPLSAVMNDLMRLIYRRFEFKEICIGLREPRDGKLRYKYFLGITGTARSQLEKFEYTQEEFFDDKENPGLWISQSTKFFISGEGEYETWERGSFNRPLIINSTRDNMDEDREGDYIDVHIFGKKKKLLGWIELSHTSSGKIPSPESIRWIELIAGMLAPILQSEDEDCRR